MLARAALACTAILLVYLLAPLLVILPVSVTDERVLALPQESLSLQHYRRFVEAPEWFAAAGQSLAIGLASASLATALGFLAAAAVWLNRGITARLVSLLLVLPMVVPGIVIALGMLRLYVWTGLLDTWAGVVLAHTVVGLPYAFVLSLAGLAALPVALFQTARALGAGPLRALALVVLPCCRASVLSGFVFAFLHSWDELVLTLFLASRTIQTLPRMMWDGLQENLDPVIAAVSVLLLLVSTSLLAGFAWLSRGGAR
jgi:putative spermidine/putrescine transport system permease protein